ncbi:cytochrome P450 [Aspergillus foveolatus]|uniref:cytochrome P450 n=1 Tax=Aspergillus foveolatus TaxID=210207 RepID=UPI003CCDB0D4
MLVIYLLVGVAVAWLVSRLLFDPLSHIPGPFISRILPLYYIRMIRNGNYIFTLKGLHAKYGPVVRLGPSDVSFATISAFDCIYGVAGDRHFVISGSRRNMLVQQDTMVDIMLSNCVTKGVREWLRPLVTSSLNNLTGAPTERMFNVAFADALKLHQVGRRESRSMPIALDSLILDYMWNLGSLLAFGKRAKESSRTNFDRLIDDNERFACFLEICYCFAGRFTLQKHRQSIYNVWRVLCKLARLPELCDDDGEHGTIIVEDNQYALIKVAAKEMGKVDLPEIYSIVNSYSTKLSIYATGHTANAMFYYLLKNERCLQALEVELLSVFQSYSGICTERLVSLPYLNACIAEVLRLAPPFSAGILQRVSRGATVDGIYVPAGTGVAVDQYSLAHSEEHWDSPASFLPERWLDSGSRKTNKASRPFLFGTRACPGRNMAMQLLRLILAKTIYLYRLQLVNTEFDITNSCSRVGWTGIELRVMMEPRLEGVLGYE